MITESKFARQRHRTALEENKKKKDATVGEQMKRNATNELEELKKKKARLVGEQQEELAVLNSEQRFYCIINNPKINKRRFLHVFY